MFRKIKTLYNFAFNNRIANYIVGSQFGKITAFVAKDATKGPRLFFKGVNHARRAPKMYKKLFPDKNLNSKQRRNLRFGIFNKNMKEVYSDPAQIGAVIGAFIPFPFANPAGYLIGSGLKLGYRYASNLLKSV